ncbi:uncharacterized protein [Chironomus tepperi]|uniref:uncharacterized protein n=1 Tax=Chironomus tepperi TaxID=113505 RepID=UPI00391F7C61
MAARMPENLAKLSHEEFNKFIEKFDVIFFDCDGVLWSFNTPLPGGCESVNALKTLGKRVYLVTNNSQTHRDYIIQKCKQIGYKITIDDIFTSTYVAAHYLKQTGFDKTLYVIGPEQLGKDLDDVGIKHIGIGPDVIEGPLYEHITKRYKLDENVGAVLVSFDRHFSYIKLCKAVNYLKNQNIKYYATNADNYFDLPQFNFLLSEVGCFIKAIEAATNRLPEILSKPSTHICNVIAKDCPPFDSSRALVIGDTLTSDMIFGKNAGYSTLFVETGMSKMNEVKEIVDKINGGDERDVLKKMVPDYTISSLDKFYELLKKVDMKSQIKIKHSL